MRFRNAVVLAACLLLCFGTGDSSAQRRSRQPKRPAPARINADYGKYEFSVLTLDGKTVHLSDFAGKVVLVNLWAPWCRPCRIETPGFVSLYRKYGARGFRVIGIAVKTTEGDVRSFMQEFGIPWPVALNDDIARAYGTYGLPDSYLFGRDGTLLKRFIGYAKEDALVPILDRELPSSAVK